MNKISTKITRIGMVSFLLFLLSSLTLVAQTPTTFNYQAVLRDATGHILESSNVSVQLVIHQATETGTIVYSEVHNTSTSEFGLVNLEIGSITPASFATIDWAAGPYFIEVIVNGTTMGASELLTVPYALYAVNLAPGAFTEVDGSTTNELQSLSLAGTDLTISSGNTVDLGGIVSRTISMPASALSVSPTTTFITPHARGLLWEQNFQGGANFYIKRPDNYEGGDVTLTLFFHTTTSTAGVVAFFLRPGSLNALSGIVDPGSISGTSVSVSGTSGFGRVYEQSFTIPANRLTNDWWYSSIQRQGSGSTYADDVVLMAVTLEY